VPEAKFKEWLKSREALSGSSASSSSSTPGSAG